MACVNVEVSEETRIAHFQFRFVVALLQPDVVDSHGQYFLALGTANAIGEAGEQREHFERSEWKDEP